MKTSYPRPRILVSRCLGFAACRYDGQQLRCKVVDMLRDQVDFVPVCPEMEAGLGVPRPPIRLCWKNEQIDVRQPAENRSVTDVLNKAALHFIEEAAGCDGAILKSKSPSCALTDAKIYRSISNPQFMRRDSGIFGAQVLSKMENKAVDDEQRLTNLILRDHFLIKLYAQARFRAITEQPTMGDLVNFHASHKLLFLAYNQSRFRICGKITANHERLPVSEVLERYATEMGRILARPFRRQAMVNTLYHAYGWITEHLSSEEKQYISNTIEEYRDERIALQGVTRLIEAEAIRFKRDYLLSQVLLRPFPTQLSDLSDSGRGREVT